MFIIEEIKTAHSKVKSGADFPAYIQEIKKLGVTNYETYVFDGHSTYFDASNQSKSTEEKYDVLVVSDSVNVEQFKLDLKTHQQGNTDYLTFCQDCAKAGIEKWVVDLNKMTCTYFLGTGEAVLEEKVPG